jgi:cytochrome P450
VSDGRGVARTGRADRNSGTISWALHALACRPQMQTKLRTECLAYGESLPFEQLDQLPYLDAVVMEVLRVYPSLPSTVSGIASRLDAAYTPQIREAQKDDIIPLAEPIQDRNGKTVSSIRIRRGQVIYVPIEQLQVATCVWGPDAREFNPERWLNTGASQATPDGAAPESAPASSKRPTGVPDGPGVWPNILTFIDGPRRCVGYKLALMQIKMILYALIRDFEFAPAPEKQIYKWNL